MTRTPSLTTTLRATAVSILVVAVVCTPVAGTVAAATDHAPTAAAGAPPESPSNSTDDAGWQHTEHTRPAGDIVSLSLTLPDRIPNDHPVYIHVGGADAGFLDVVRAVDTDADGTITLGINTRTLGTSTSLSPTNTENVYYSGGDTVTSGVHGRLDGDPGPRFVGPDGTQLDGFADYLATVGLIRSADRERPTAQLPRPLQPGTYTVTATTNRTISAQARTDGATTALTSSPADGGFDTATVSLTTPGVHNITVNTAPAGAADAAPNATALAASMTDQRPPTTTDRVVIAANATGIYGHLAAIAGGPDALASGVAPSTLSTLEARTGEGVQFAVEATNSPVLKGPDSPPGIESPLEILDLSSADPAAASVYANASRGRLYVVVDPQAVADFQPSSGTDFQNLSASLTYETDPADAFQFDRGDNNIQTYYRSLLGGAGGDITIPAFPYLAPGTNETASDDFQVVTPRTRFDLRADSGDGRLLTRAQPTHVSGVTNLAPGTEATVRVSFAESNGSFGYIQRSTATVAANGTFTGTVDLPVPTVGETVTLTMFVADDTVAHTTATVTDPTRTTTAATTTPETQSETTTTSRETGGPTPGFTAVGALVAVVIVFAGVGLRRRRE
ncbi:cell surface protein [Halobacterium salinarum]|uniref:BGTF surface domain-containing protein n=1 Tax=Halobacterium salinarum TaxID=2242 RepID=UPI002553411B|nr:BGTF surface domain-containing protein [Halobacterium salinarum]MDL0131879.1 cell surface protein [Halobacterium salinarum]